MADHLCARVPLTALPPCAALLLRREVLTFELPWVRLQRALCRLSLHASPTLQSTAPSTANHTAGEHCTECWLWLRPAHGDVVGNAQA